MNHLAACGEELESGVWRCLTEELLHGAGPLQLTPTAERAGAKAGERTEAEGESWSTGGASSGVPSDSGGPTLN